MSDCFVTPWTVAHQAPLSMGILQTRIQEWVVISFSRDLPNPGVKTESPALAGRFFTTEPPGSPYITYLEITMKIALLSCPTRSLFWDQGSEIRVSCLLPVALVFPEESGKWVSPCAYTTVATDIHDETLAPPRGLTHISHPASSISQE